MPFPQVLIQIIGVELEHLIEKLGKLLERCFHEDLIAPLTPGPLRLRSGRAPPTRGEGGRRPGEGYDSDVDLFSHQTFSILLVKL